MLLFVLFACSGTKPGETSGDDTSTGRHHPKGFEAADQHGLPAKLQEEECVTCHGADLTGGTSGVSCDTCHTSGWRTDC